MDPDILWKSCGLLSTAATASRVRTSRAWLGARGPSPLLGTAPMVNLEKTRYRGAAPAEPGMGLSLDLSPHDAFFPALERAGS